MPRKLTDIEFSLIKTHPQNGFDIIKEIEFPWPIEKIIVQHHERIDGSGYPYQLKGDEICIEARIVAVADVVEAMSSHRPYRASLALTDAINEITQWRGIRYDATVVDAAVRLLEKYGQQVFESVIQSE